MRKLIWIILLTSPILGMCQGLAPVPGWHAKWIEAVDKGDTTLRPGQYFQKRFNAAKKIKAARLLITCHGLYEASLNGKRVGDAVLTPGWTSYHKRLQYQIYDVTALLVKGENSFQVVLGDGWYRGYVGFLGYRGVFGKNLALLAQVELTYADGGTELVVSDESWKVGTGPVLGNDILMGETIDANRSVGSWLPVKVVDHGYAGVVATENEPVRRHEVFKPIKVITTPKGEKVIDFGQNLVGWVKVTLHGKKGDTVRIYHAEVLDKEGNFYTANLRNAAARMKYVLSGNGTESFEPHFTFFGFRYIKVVGVSGELDPADFSAVALYSDMKPTGSFECSNPLINQLQHNIQWGQRGNFLDVPTDCPQRDERLGWTGDAQAFFRTAAFNFDVKSFFTKWMKDVALDQLPNGSVTAVVPDILNGFGGSAGWADVATIIPWQQYEVYGDKAVLAGQYPMMKKWVDYIGSVSRHDLWQSGFHFGDWLSYRPGNDDGTEAVTDKFQIAQCFWAHSTQNLINAARVLGKTEDVAFYSAVLSRVKAAFVREYVTGSGRLMSNTQTAYVLALHFDMLPEGMRAGAAKYLVDNIKLYDNHLSTGFLGTPYICHVLSRFGYLDMAYTLLNQDTFPSWLYPVKKGATTIWERWDGIKPDGSFQTTRMNSFNHYAYGAIGDWLYRVVAGINTDSVSVAYKKVVIRPMPGGGLSWARASYESVHGRIISGWKLKGNVVELQVEIPKGVTAEVWVPGDAMVKKVGAGKHQFEGKL